jgi:hypothetical protein
MAVHVQLERCLLSRMEGIYEPFCDDIISVLVHTASNCRVSDG